MSPITKDVERSAAMVLSKTAAHQPVQTVEALAHVAAVDQQKDLQAPAEADHRFAPSRPSKSAANAASVALTDQITILVQQIRDRYHLQSATQALTQPQPR